MVGLRALLVWFDARRRLVAGLLACWALVIVGGSGAATGESQWLGVPRVDRLLVALAVVYVVVVVGILVFAVATNARRPTELPERSSQWRVLLLLVLLVFASLVFPRGSGDEAADADTVPPVEVAETADEGRRLVDRDESIVLVALLVTAVGVLVWSRRRVGGRSDESVRLMSASELEPLVDSAIGELQLGADPRSSVILAYSRLEEALAAHGTARQAAETPTEHLDRSLAHLALDTAPLRELAALYEVARFSDHPVTAVDQRQATDGLVRIRRALAAVEPVTESHSRSSTGR